MNKKIQESPIRVAGVVAVIVALVGGMALIQQDSLSLFFILYYTRVVPVVLTAGTLAFFIALACKDIRSRSGTSNERYKR